MSSCPGLYLEDYLEDIYGIVKTEDGKIKLHYAGDILLTNEQFVELVKIYEPVRNEVETRLGWYDEETCGSWRDYKYLVIGDIISVKCCFIARRKQLVCFKVCIFMAE